MTPKTAKTSRKVPTNSAKNAWYHGIASPYAATPSPRSLALLPSTPTIAKAPATAPATCAATYDGTSDHGNLPVAARPKVTAGLMWLPLM